jgi:hypothetical protein
LQGVEKLFPASDRLPGSSVTLILSEVGLSPFVIEAEDVRSKLAVSWGHQPAGLLKHGEQEVNKH